MMSPEWFPICILWPTSIGLLNNINNQPARFTIGSFKATAKPAVNNLRKVVIDLASSIHIKESYYAYQNKGVLNTTLPILALPYIFYFPINHINQGFL